MIGYVTIGVNDFEAAKTFYDKALAGLGAKRAFANERMQGYASTISPVQLMICKPYDGAKASAGNGTMISLLAQSRDVVDAVYRDAVAAGAKDEGAPGDRGNGFYGAYFRDPDGNKICVFKMG
jgi:catechol 2,3-dioxygenase-like lactoylglutathione lyase family enzyme